jgi:hypothetical protein
MDNSSFIAQPKEEKDATRKKEVKEEEAGTGISSTDSVNYGSELDYQIYILLG